MLRVVHITPNHTPMFAVYADGNGQPEFCPVVCWGCMEEPESGHRVVAGYAVRGHPEPSDCQPEFLGYAYDKNPAEWSAKAQKRREELEQKKRQQAEEAGKKKIIVPGEKKVVDPFNAN